MQILDVGWMNPPSFTLKEDQSGCFLFCFFLQPVKAGSDGLSRPIGARGATLDISATAPWWVSWLKPVRIKAKTSLSLGKAFSAALCVCVILNVKIPPSSHTNSRYRSTRGTFRSISALIYSLNDFFSFYLGLLGTICISHFLVPSQLNGGRLLPTFFVN